VALCRFTKVFHGFMNLFFFFQNKEMLRTGAHISNISANLSFLGVRISVHKSTPDFALIRAASDAIGRLRNNLLQRLLIHQFPG
jgi:hypothetical protein